MGVSFDTADYEARTAAQKALIAAAEGLGVPRYIKEAGRWCRLEKIEGDRLTYLARPKQERTRRARHQPVVVEKNVREMQDAAAVDQILREVGEIIHKTGGA